MGLTQPAGDPSLHVPQEKRPCRPPAFLHCPACIRSGSPAGLKEYVLLRRNSCSVAGQMKNWMDSVSIMRWLPGRVGFVGWGTGWERGGSLCFGLDGSLPGTANPPAPSSQCAGRGLLRTSTLFLISLYLTFLNFLCINFPTRQTFNLFGFFFFLH